MGRIAVFIAYVALVVGVAGSLRFPNATAAIRSISALENSKVTPLDPKGYDSVFDSRVYEYPASRYRKFLEAVKTSLASLDKYKGYPKIVDILYGQILKEKQVYSYFMTMGGVKGNLYDVVHDPKELHDSPHSPHFYILTIKPTNQPLDGKIRGLVKTRKLKEARKLANKMPGFYGNGGFHGFYGIFQRVSKGYGGSQRFLRNSYMVSNGSDDISVEDVGGGYQLRRRRRRRRR